jgi:iron complex outermembrane receptor protein
MPHPLLAAALASACLPAPAVQAPPAPAPDSEDILVVAPRQERTIGDPPSPRATVTARQIEDSVNALNVEDTVKYLPSLIVRKRHIGDTQAPLATRTSGLGASARSLVFADGALLSSLIGNNNTSASPRWSMVSPEEVERIDILYGPYSAAYAGNSIGAVVNITTRLPDTFEGSLTAAASVQTFDQYGTHRTLPARQFAATLGDRIGPLALFASVTHTKSDSQPLTYVTAARPAAPSARGIPTLGGFDGVNRLGQPIRILGASGFEHQVQDNVKLKAALDLSPSVRLAYVGGLFLNDTAATAQTYLGDAASGHPVYVSPTAPAAPLNIDGFPYTIAPAAFDSGVYLYEERHWSHALSATGSGRRFDWQAIATLYDFAHDVQRQPTGALPGALAGGPGNITRLNGTGWATFDAKGAWHSDERSTNILSAGFHFDGFRVNSNRYATADWLSGDAGALNQASRGKTRTLALWAQDELKLAEPLTLTIGTRLEWWRAYDGFNFALAPALSVHQPERTAAGFSPKASLAYTPGSGWTARLSIGKAYRFPTVGELYQAITTGAVLTVPDPNLRPERALSEELSLERSEGQGSWRLSLFNEIVEDALISQSAPLVPGSSAAFTFVQNVGRTRARGVELAVQRTDLLLRGFDFAGSLTYTDATTREDEAFPAAVGRMLPSVPRWKASAVATWRPTPAIALTAAARYGSRSFATLDNSDAVGRTYQGFSSYFIVDLRANFRISERFTFAIGVDNARGAEYFLFHPFPQRTYQTSLSIRF